MCLKISDVIEFCVHVSLCVFQSRFVELIDLMFSYICDACRRSKLSTNLIKISQNWNNDSKK